MGWAQNGGRGRQFLINFFPHAQFAGDGRGSLPLRTVRCVGTAPPALLPASAVPPGSAVLWGTSSGTWAPQQLSVQVLASVDPGLESGPGRQTIVTHRGSTNRV